MNNTDVITSGSSSNNNSLVGLLCDGLTLVSLCCNDSGCVCLVLMMDVLLIWPFICLDSGLIQRLT
jgi:hypothetical protein